MARPHVPKFGNWENEGSVPYTVYFDKARNNRKGEKIINPNDPEENPELFYGKEPQVQPQPSQPNEPIRQPAARPMHERRRSRENNELRQSAASPYQKTKVPGRGVEASFPSPEKGAAVPVFGEWNESKPESGDGYTQIFNKVREEKQTGGMARAGAEARVSVPPYNHGGKRQNSEDSSKIGCFSWLKKLL